MMLDGPGLVAREYCLTVCLCADDGGFADTESLDLQTSAVLRRALPLMTGRPLEEAYRELVLLNDVPGPVTGQTAASPFVRKRRLFVRELHQAGLF